MKKVKLGKYQHYSGKFYMVLGEAIHSETLEEMVIYQGLYKHPMFGYDTVWARPKKMFLEKVEVGGRKVPRFKFVK